MSLIHRHYLKINEPSNNFPFYRLLCRPKNVKKKKIKFYTYQLCESRSKVQCRTVAMCNFNKLDKVSSHRNCICSVIFKKLKHFPCFYRVIVTRVEFWENEKCCGNNSRRRVFRQLFRVLPNLHQCFYHSIETRRKYFLLLLENSPRKIKENEENLIVLFIIKT